MELKIHYEWIRLDTKWFRMKQNCRNCEKSLLDCMRIVTS